MTSSPNSLLVDRKPSAEEAFSHETTIRQHEDGSQSRFDAVLGNWVVFAPQREQRPNDFQRPAEIPAEKLLCPFCVGNESQTPPAVLTVEAQEDAALRDVAAIEGLIAKETHSRVSSTRDSALSQHPWVVRVVPNKFPAVSDHKEDPSSGELWKQHSTPWSARQTEKVEVGGGHEVVIESGDHVASWSQLDPANVEQVMLAWKQRILKWRSCERVRYVSVFKNVGCDAGASLEHCHSQIIALDQLPVQTRFTLERMRHHHARTGCCLQCDLIRHEIKSRERVIAKTDDLVAYCPFASAFGMMVRITSLRHMDCYEDQSDQVISHIARLLRRITHWLESTRPNVAYNYVLNTRPPNWGGDPAAFHWSIDLIPRIGHIAGFEIGCGTMLNSVLPETAATIYRKLASAENPRAL